MSHRRDEWQPGPPWAAAELPRVVQDRVRHALVVASVSMVIVVSGCSPSPEAAPTAPTAGPLDELYALLPENTAERAVADSVAREAAVAQCMTAAGFDYVPNPTTLDDASKLTLFSTDSAPRTRAETALQGYGMATWNDGDPANDGTILQVLQSPDPNRAYIDSLSPQAQEAFYLALYGAQSVPDDGFSTIEYAQTWTERGCSGVGEHTLGATTPWGNEQLLDFVTRAQGLREELPTTDTMRSLARTWSGCMADAGHPDLERPTDAATRAMEASNALADETMFDDDDVAAAKFAELAAVEVDLALADYDCKESLDWTAAESAALLVLEERFVADNRAELDELIAAFEAAGWTQDDRS